MLSFRLVYQLLTRKRSYVFLFCASVSVGGTSIIEHKIAVSVIFYFKSPHSWLMITSFQVKWSHFHLFTSNTYCAAYEVENTYIILHLNDRCVRGKHSMPQNNCKPFSIYVLFTWSHREQSLCLVKSFNTN